MKISSLLDQLKPVREIQTVETKYPDGTRTYTFSTVYPVPRAPEPAWYVIVIKPGQEDVDDREIEAMLRHLWMAQVQMRPDKPTT